MKSALFLIAIIASASAIARQVSDEDQIPRRDLVSLTVPPSALLSDHDVIAAPPRAPRITNDDEFIYLLRAQTTAIKALSSKLDSLEERITKIEKKAR